MIKSLLKILLPCCLGSCEIGAMENAGPWNFLNLEIFATNADLDIDDYVHFANSNSVMYSLIAQDSFWKIIYRKLKRDNNKLKPELNYAQNYMKLISALTIVHLDTTCPLFTNDTNLVKKFKIEYRELLLFADAHTQYENLIIQALEEEPKVFGSFFSNFSGSFVWSENKKKILDLSLSKDVLMVFPAHNYSETCASDALGFDLHEAYPNVVWVASCSPEGTLEVFTNIGTLIDIAAPSLDDRRGTAISAFNVVKFVGQLRALRPELTALEIRSLLIKSADRTKESLQKIPCGGILNREAAIEAVKNHRAKAKD
jgi:hypothetical protein